MFAVRLSAVLAIAASVAGCGTPAGPRVVDPAPAANALLDRGYRADRRHGFEDGTERMFDAEAPIDLVWLVPTGTAARVPLVVWFPGLGEPASANRLWRTTWAEAGYAVLAVQPDAWGPGAARSQRARAGDFRGLAVDAFGRDALARRLVQARNAIDLVRRRAAEGVAPWNRIDTSRIVVAGFHLGAQTALALAGDRDVVASLVLGWSGPPPAAAPGEASRLVVEATGDADPFGGSTRSAGAIPARRLLTLNGGSHALLAGNGYLGPLQARDAMAPGVPGRTPPDRIPRTRGEVEFERQVVGANNARENALRRLPEREAFDPALVAAVQGVSVAFLDDVVTGSMRARTWLERDAATWLGTGSRLR
jgi:dienelactone hydrolase